MAEVINANDGTLNARAGSIGGTSMRYHELALQRWLNQLFYVREGYPVPVVLGAPMDAFSYFAQLWADEDNPFAYLLNLKDDTGKPLYEPHPSMIRYPIISVYRKGWKYRPYQNFSIHRWRHINWPTVSNTGTERYGPLAQGWELSKCGLGNVTTSRMPMAWDYRFQIDFFCNRPDTVAFFVEQLMQEFWRSGGTPQTWIAVPYPGWGNRRVRLYLDGEIENLTPEEPEEGKNVEFRVSFTVIVEGFDVDLRYEVYPALWDIIFRFGPADPQYLADAFTKTVDIRLGGTNTTLDRRPNVPPWGACQTALRDNDQVSVSILGVNDTPNNSFGVFQVGTDQPIITLYGTDAAATDARFVDGSADLYVNRQHTGASVGFGGGQLHDAAVFGGTHVRAVGENIGFTSGALVDTILATSGTDYGASSAQFANGTLFDAVVSAGSHTESTANAVSFTNGTLITWIVLGGTPVESVNVQVGFLNGTLA